MSNRTFEDGGSHASEIDKATVPQGDETVYRSWRAAVYARAPELPGFVGVEGVLPAAGGRGWCLGAVRLKMGGGAVGNRGTGARQVLLEAREVGDGAGVGAQQVAHEAREAEGGVGNWQAACL